MAKKIKETLQTNNNTAQSNAVFLTSVKVKNPVVRELQNKPKNEQKTKRVLNVKNISIRKIKTTKYKNLTGKTTLQHFTVSKKNDFKDELNYNLNESDLQSGMLMRATRMVKNHYSKKRGIYQFLFVMLNIFVIFGILLYQKNTLGVMSFNDLVAAKNQSSIYLLYAFIAFLLIMVLEGLRTHILIFKATKFNKPLLSLKSTMISRYYDCLIPVAGGKPFELFYLHSRGIKPSVATSVPLAKYIFSLIATIITSTVVIISKWSFLQESNDFVLALGIVMLIVNMFLVFLMVLFSVSKKFAPKLVLSTLLFLEKLHIVKNHRKQFFGFMRFVLEYQKSVEYYLKTKFVAILSVLFSLAISLLKAITPFLIYAIFATPNMDLLLDLMSKYYILVITINYVPIPGGTGVVELTFAALFMDYFTDGTLFWAIMLWRFFSYYIYLFQGLVVLVYDYFANKKRFKKFTDIKQEIIIESE